MESLKFWKNPSTLTKPRNSNEEEVFFFFSLKIGQPRWPTTDKNTSWNCKITLKRRFWTWTIFRFPCSTTARCNNRWRFLRPNPWPGLMFYLQALVGRGCGTKKRCPLSLLLSSSPLSLLLLLLMMRRDQRPRSQLIAVRLLQVFTKYSGCHPILKGPKPEGHHVTNHRIMTNPQTLDLPTVANFRIAFSSVNIKLGNRPPKGELGDSTHQNRPC